MMISRGVVAQARKTWSPAAQPSELIISGDSDEREGEASVELVDRYSLCADVMMMAVVGPWLWLVGLG